MFSGIVSAIGTLRELRPITAQDDMRLMIAAPWPDTKEIAIGASICCSGCCLTVIERSADWFGLEASAETLNRTTLGRWRVGHRLNLERSLRLGDEIGGHFVFGHVDGLAEALEVAPEHGSIRLRFRAPAALMRLIAVKGSIAVDGVSLTVNTVDRDSFSVNVIPHTAEQTTLGALKVGDPANLEIDMLARYVARLAEAR